MKTGWLKRIGGAAAMGVAWATVWAPIAVLFGLIIDPDGSMDEMWVAIGAYPGFLSAVVLSAVLGFTGSRLDELPLSRAATWGAVAGLLVGVFPFTIGESTSQLPLWLLAAIVISTITLLSAASAVASAMLLRYAARRRTTGTRAAHG